MEYTEYVELRNTVGLKDSKVAQLSGIGQSTFSDWKSGRSKPKEEKIEKILNVLAEAGARIPQKPKGLDLFVQIEPKADVEIAKDSAKRLMMYYSKIANLALEQQELIFKMVDQMEAKNE